MAFCVYLSYPELIYVFYLLPIDTSVTVLPPKPEKTLDLEAEGTINGVGVYSFDLDTSQEKPWNKPGK